MPDEELSGRERLASAMRRPASRGQAIAAVLLAFVGFGGAVQVRANEGDAYAGTRQEDLVQLLDSLAAASERAENEIGRLEETRRSLLGDAEAGNAALEQARRQARVLSILAGTVPAAGPGVVVTVRDPSGGIGIDQMLNGLEELRDAGAEAIEINNSVRVVAQTSLGDSSGTGGAEEAVGGIVVDGQQIRAPYTIEAIGDPHTLAQALDFSGGFTDDVESPAVGGEVVVEERENVEVRTVREPQQPEYAVPVEE